MKSLIITSVLLFILGFLMFGITVRGIYGNPKPQDIKNNLDQAAMPLELSPERGRYVLIMSLAEDHSFALKPILADTADPDIGYYKGNFYIYFGPGVSLLALPFYHIGKPYNLAQVASFLTIAFFAAANLVCIFLIARRMLRLKWSYAMLAAVIFGFCSPAWSYANTLYQHHVTTFIILSSLYAVWLYKKNSKFGWIGMAYVWLAYGYSIFIDYPNVILVWPIALYGLIVSLRNVSVVKQRLHMSLRAGFFITAVLFILVNAVHGYYNSVHFGSWKSLSGGLVGIKEIKRYGVLKAKDPQAVIAKMAKSKNVVRFFDEKSAPRGFSILFFSRDRGLFLYAPIFIVSILGVALSFYSITLEMVILYILIGIHVLLYSSWGDPWGGWAYGPRYMIPTMSILSLFAAFAVSKVRVFYIVPILTFILMCYSSAIGLLGALTTNAVPPKVEGDYLKIGYNFMRNYTFLLDDHSSSFVYNYFIKTHFALPQFFIMLWIPVIACAAVLLFVIPSFERNS